MPSGRVVAVGAAAIALVIAWARGRRRRSAASPASHVLPRGAPLDCRPHEVSLVSYNVLCQRYATTRRLPHVLGRYLDPEYRQALLRAELAAFGAVDLVALQEVTVRGPI